MLQIARAELLDAPQTILSPPTSKVSDLVTGYVHMTIPFMHIYMHDCVFVVHVCVLTLSLEPGH